MGLQRECETYCACLRQLLTAEDALFANNANNSVIEQKKITTLLGIFSPCQRLHVRIRNIRNTHIFRERCFMSLKLPATVKIGVKMTVSRFFLVMDSGWQYDVCSSKQSSGGHSLKQYGLVLSLGTTEELSLARYVVPLGLVHVTEHTLLPSVGSQTLNFGTGALDRCWP